MPVKMLPKEGVMSPAEWARHDEALRQLRQALSKIDESVRLRKLANSDLMHAQLPQPTPMPGQSAARQFVDRRPWKPSDAPTQQAYQTPQVPQYQSPAPAYPQATQPVPQYPAAQQQPQFRLPDPQPMPEFKPQLPDVPAATRVEPDYHSSSYQPAGQSKDGKSSFRSLLGF